MLIYLSMIEDPVQKDKFTLLYDRYRHQMYQKAYQILKNEQDAEDVVHDVLLKTVDHLGRLPKDPAHPKCRAFLLTLVENRAIDLYRKRKKNKIVPFDEAWGIYSEMPLSHEVEDLFGALPPQDRTVLLLRYNMGYGVKEIAKMLGKTPNAITKAIQLAKEHLKAYLKKEGYHYDYADR